MHYWFLIPPGYFAMWLVTARVMYRLWYNEEDNITKDDRAARSSGWGFIWPVTLTFFVFLMVFVTVELSMTAPSLKEHREKKLAVKQERLRDLNHQIDQAEADLCEATAIARIAQEKVEHPEDFS